MEKASEKSKEKQKKPTFYEASVPWGNMLREGASITIARELMYKGAHADFTPFLCVPVKELEQRLKASKAEEKKIFEQLQEAAKAWDEHGAQTLLLQKAIEYLKVPVITHTSNEWKKQKDGSWEISNLTYKMTFSIVKVGGEWKLVWEVSYMAPGLQVGYRGYERTPRERIEYEGSKKYKTMDGAQKYVQLKFDQYSSCFKELSPPVPAEAKDLFCVNGQLLQGYRLARPQMQKKEASVADLLDCLEEGDLSPQKPTAMPARPPQHKEPVPVADTGKAMARQAGEKPQATHPPKKKPLHKKELAPAR